MLFNFDNRVFKLVFYRRHCDDIDFDRDSYTVIRWLHYHWIFFLSSSRGEETYLNFLSSHICLKFIIVFSLIYYDQNHRFIIMSYLKCQNSVKSKNLPNASKDFGIMKSSCINDEQNNSLALMGVYQWLSSIFKCFVNYSLHYFLT